MLVAPRCSASASGSRSPRSGNLIVQPCPAHQTGVAGGMNTVMRTLGGALGGQLAATFIANNRATGTRP